MEKVHLRQQSVSVNQSKLQEHVASEARRDSRCFSFAKALTGLLALSSAAAFASRGLFAGASNAVSVAGPGPLIDGPALPIDPLQAIPQPLPAAASFSTPDSGFAGKSRRKSKAPPAAAASAPAKPPEQELMKQLFQAGAKRVFVLELHKWKGNLEAMSAVFEGANDAGVRPSYYREVTSALECEAMEQAMKRPRVVAKIVNEMFTVGESAAADAPTRRKLDRLAQMVNENGGAWAICFQDPKYALGRAIKGPGPSILNIGYAHGMGRWLDRNQVAAAECVSDVSADPATAYFAALDDARQKDAFDGVSRAVPGGGVVVVVPRTMWGVRQSCVESSGAATEGRYDYARISQELGQMGLVGTDVGELTVFSSADLRREHPAPAEPPHPAAGPARKRGEL